MNLPLLLLAASAALFFWPAGKRPAVGELRVPPPMDPATGKTRPTYQSCLVALAAVRLRLVQTESLSDETREAIDRLTLALVAGSDQE